MYCIHSALMTDIQAFLNELLLLLLFQATPQGKVLQYMAAQ